MIDRAALVRALAQRRVADWVVAERAQELALADPARQLLRSEDRHRLELVVHHDTPRGRGSARLALAVGAGDATEIVAQAVDLATAAVGPAWRSPPAAAPARVELLDPALADGPLAAIAAALARSVRGAEIAVSALREQVTVQTRAGLTTTWRASQLAAQVLVIAGARSLALGRVARRAADLDLAAVVEEARGHLAQLATAAAPVPGRCALVLTSDALLHGDGDALGVWSAFAAQADGALERQGLTRYRLGAPIAAGLDRITEPLSIASDGALDFATRSAPIGDDGDPIRRFPLVERGLCVGLGLGAHEAARRRLEPNGGVRNLDVAPGSWDHSLPVARTVEVLRLRALTIDTYTGDANLELSLAIDHQAGAHRAFTGGTVRLDLIAALAQARRSARVIRRGAYRGPAAVLIEDVELIA